MAVRRIDCECSSAVHVRQGVETKPMIVLQYATAWEDQFLKRDKATADIVPGSDLQASVSMLK